MNNQITLKDRIKGQTILVILYIVSKIATFFLLLDIDAKINWREELERFICMIAIIFIVTVFFISANIFNRRKYSVYFVGGECIIFSLIILYMILKRYYNLYETLALGIIYIYVAVVVILFLLCKNFYKKLPSEEELDKKKKIEPQKGLAYVVAASTLGVSRYLSTEQEYVIGIIISIIISCGQSGSWLVYVSRDKSIYK